MSGAGSYGPKPWLQTSWDARAAANFIGGGAGGGLIVFTLLSGATGTAFSLLVVAGLGLVALGLFAVGLELGRPLRALRVLVNPRTSWMSREAWSATLLFPVGLGAALGVSSLAWLAALLALVFVYCQARILQAAKGIPAWRERLITPLLVSSGLADGAAVVLATAPLQGAAQPTILALFAALMIVRFAVWLAYRRRLDNAVAPEARAALDAAGRVLVFAGTLAPLALAGGAAFAGDYALLLAGLAGLFAALAGANLKLDIVTRAGFNQGFALARMPVRGVRR